jgi:hypothetical protein
METRTPNGSGDRKSDLLIRCDDSIPAPDIDWLVKLIEGMVRVGYKYGAGEIIEVGWMPVQVFDVGDGTLLLREPDMRAIPFKWTDGVTETLRQLRLQKDTAESFGFGKSMQFPSVRDSAIVGVDVRQNDSILILDRVEAKGTDSGWFIGRLNSQLDYNDPGNLRRDSLYAAAILCPAAIMFMALPFGIVVEISEGQIAVTHHGKSVAPRTNSFLSKWLRHFAAFRD